MVSVQMETCWKVWYIAKRDIAHGYDLQPRRKLEHTKLVSTSSKELKRAEDNHKCKDVLTFNCIFSSAEGSADENIHIFIMHGFI